MSPSVQALPFARFLAARRARAVAAIAGPAVVLLLAALLAVGSGALPISSHATIRALYSGVFGRASALEGDEAIVWNLRLPRVLMAALVGASLGCSGGALQGLFRNPLVDPYLLGIAGGATFGATLAMSIGGRLAQPFAEALFAPGGASVLVPLYAFLGSIGAVTLTLLLARAGTKSRATSLLLAGIVVGSILVASTQCLMMRDSDRLHALVSWTLGNLAMTSWADLRWAFPYAVSGMVVLYALARGLDSLQLGEETARTLGVRTRTLRVGVIVGASLATAAAVAFVGAIGFVGLVAPHAMRRIGTPQHRVLLPASALAGAALLVLADLAARTVVRPAELPVGVVTTLLGGPFFLWLLRRRS